MSNNNNTLRLVRGINWEYVCKLLDSDNKPIDITGYQAKMKVRTNIDSKEVLAELTTENGRIEIIDPIQGSFVLKMPSLLTSNFPLGIVSFDILLTSPLGKQILLAEGAKIRVVDYVSR